MQKTITVRLDEELIERIKKMAETNHRSMNGEIEYILSEKAKTCEVTQPA